jgi:hypothetical protein
MTLLPRRTVGGTDTSSKYGTENALFYRLDWQWYLNMQGVSPQFGRAEPETWAFSPEVENFSQAPRDDILKTPVFAALTCPAYIDVQLPLFPNLGPVMKEQLGLNAEEGEREAAREVDQVIFHQPGIMYFVGADLEPVREALAGQKIEGFDRAYRGGGEDSRYRRIAIAEPDGVPVVILMVDNFTINLMWPGIDLAFRGEDATPVVAEESIQWCLDQLVNAWAPVVTGEVDGGAPEWSDYPHGNRNVRALGDYDTLITTMDASKYAATVQTTVSSVDGNAPTEEELREALEGSGNYSTRYHPDVSNITATWP